MSSIESTIKEARADAAPTLGQMALALAARRGVSRARLREWVYLLRRAADTLEKFEKERFE